MGVVNENIDLFPEKARQFINKAQVYCMGWVGTATSPITGAVANLQQGRNASTPDITKE